MLQKVVTAQVLDLCACRSCDLVFLGGAAAKPERGLYEYYRDRLEWSQEEIYIGLTTKRLSGVLAGVAKYAPGRRLLDVGCGEGQLLHAAAAAGWDAAGIDLSEPAVAVCRRFGLKASTVDFFSDTLQAASYDVITMIEFIEHVLPPGRFLRRAEELLAPGGLLFLTTPNFRSVGRWLMGSAWPAIGPGHVCYFTPKTLRRIIEDDTTLTVRAIHTKNLSAAALRRLVGDRVTPESGLDTLRRFEETNPCFASEQALRHRIEASPFLRAGKALLNAALKRAGAGEQMEVLLAKPL